MADLTIQKIFVQIWSGVDLYQAVFTDGNITFCHLRAINWILHPELYPESSDALDENLEQTFCKDSESEEEEEPLPLPILGTSLTQESEHSLNE